VDKHILHAWMRSW